MGANSVYYAMSAANIVLGLCAIALIARKNLVSSFAILFTYIVAQVVWMVSGLAVALVYGYNTRSYALTYLGGMMLTFVFSLYTVYDFWRLGLRNYRGLHRLCAFLLTATFVVLLPIVASTTEFGQGRPILDPRNFGGPWLVLLRRSVTFVEAVFMLLFFFVVVFFRVAISQIVRNLAVTLFFFLLFRVSLDSLQYLKGGYEFQSFTALLVPLSIGAMLLAWNVTIVRHVRDAPVVTAPYFSRKATPEQLAQQMDKLNDALIRLLG